MDVTFEEVKEVVETLPLGFYCSRRVPLTLEKKTDVGTSYYNPKDDNIVIDFSPIAEGLNKAPSNDPSYTKETAIRSMVYHELSHAILTPEKMRVVETYFNIFEDERIETVLSSYFHDVDFKKQVLMINGGKVTSPKNVTHAFFNLVRFRNCPEKSFIQRVENLIENYKDIYRFTDDPWYYENEVKQLWFDFQKWYKKNNSAYNNPLPQNGQGGKGGKGNSVNTSVDIKNDGQEQGEQGEKNSEQGDGQKQGEQNTNQDGKQSNGCGSGKSIKEIFDKTINRYQDNKLTERLNVIFSNFRKKNKGGCGINAYSGIINPRLVGREDYRFFERSATANGNNKFGSFHLNLFVDDSGSFCEDAEKVNTLIKSLEEIEKRNKNFTFTVIRCGDGMVITEKNERWINACQGTSADYEETKKIYKKVNSKKDALVYNILMYDGCCWWRGKNPFTIFDNAHSTVIVERGNINSVNEFKSGKVIYIKDRTYTERFIEETLNTISVAFR